MACDAAHIKNETYPLFRYIWAVLPTKLSRARDVEKFFDWARTSKAAGQIIAAPARCLRSTRANASHSAGDGR